MLNQGIPWLGILFWIATRGKNMKRILLTTTSLVLAAGVAQAEVTFSGKAEAGVSRTAKVKAVAAAFGKQTVSGSATSTANGLGYTAGVLTTADASGTLGTADATTVAAALVVLNAAKAALNVALAGQANGTLTANSAAAGTLEQVNTAADGVAAARRDVFLAQTAYNTQVGTAAVTAAAAGDMVAYSGYDMEVAVSSTLDNGMVLSAGFDMGAGSIADRDDDRELDAQGAAVALSTVTIKNGGVTYVIGQDKIDDLYDDTQNGDVSVSGAMGGVSYTIVADLDKDVTPKAATYTAASTTTGAITTADYTQAAWTDAVAKVYESTSMKLSGAAGGVDWSFTTTNKDDFGDAASLVTLGYAAGDALSFTLKHDTDGAAEAINTLSATYTMDAITLTASMADDKNHARNTNTGKKASQNLTIAYANGPLTASFNNDESSAWWATTSYDLGNGADLFATVDHTEFAVVGLTFAF
jgi:outer membrane protein OmpU